MHWGVAHDLDLTGLSDSEMAVAAPRQPRERRQLPRPHRFSSDDSVICLGYPQRAVGLRPATGQRERYSAQLCYYLPEGWSASYKFTVFEKSYVVRIETPAAAGRQQQYCVARPVHPAASGCIYQPEHGVHGGELELVWPVPLDSSILESVRKACDTRPAAKRKIEPGAESEPVLSSVSHKLRKLFV